MKSHYAFAVKKIHKTAPLSSWLWGLLFVMAVTLLSAGFGCSKKSDAIIKAEHSANSPQSFQEDNSAEKGIILQEGDFSLRIPDRGYLNCSELEMRLKDHYAMRVERAGRRTRVIVSLKNFEEVSFIALEIGFDPSKYRPVTVEDLSFMDPERRQRTVQSSMIPSFIPRSEGIGDSDSLLESPVLFFALTDVRGKVPVAIARIRPQENGYASGSGDLIAVKFENASQGPTRTILRPPTKDLLRPEQNNLTISLWPAGISWYEPRLGDYDNNGYVGILDIEPLTRHFVETSDPSDPNFWIYTKYVDGSGDGVVNAVDLSPIAFHYGETTKGYRIHEAIDENGSGAVPVAVVYRPRPPADITNSPWYISLATLQYNTQELIPGWVPKEGLYYQVAPFDLDGLESTDVRSPWTRYRANQTPVALLQVDYTRGYPPLTVNFDGTDSYDPDGEILAFLWDFESDGHYDSVWPVEEGKAYHTYTKFGTYKATLKVIDNDGAWATTAVEIRVEDWVHTLPDNALEPVGAQDVIRNKVFPANPEPN